MKIIKKLFPKYTTKRELKEKVEALQFASEFMPRRKVNAISCKAAVVMNGCMPRSACEEKVAELIAKGLRPYIKFEVVRGPECDWLLGKFTFIEGN